MDYQMNPQNLQNPQPQMRFDPMTGRPLYPTEPPKKKFPVGALVGMIVAAVVIIAAVIATVLIYNGVFLSTPEKILRAAGNTVEPNQFLKDLSASDITADGKYTTDVNLNMEGVSIDASCAVTEGAKALNATVTVSESWYSMELKGAAILDSEKLAVQIPLLGDDIYVYNYKEEKTGYITEEYTEEEIRAFDQMLENLAAGSGSDTIAEECGEIMLEEFCSLPFADLPKADWVVNGEQRSCKGYQTTITARNALNVIGQMEDLYRKTYADTYQELYKESFEELEDTFEDMPDIKVSFYIYKKQLASIVMTSGEETITIQFMGGDRPTQNMKITTPDGTIDVMGSTSGSTEWTKISMDGTTVLDMQYDTKSGAFRLEMNSGYSLSVTGDENDRIEIEGTLTSTRSSLVIDITKFELFGEVMTGKMEIKKGAEIKKLEGSAVDIGNASEERIESILEEISDAY